MSGDYFVVGRCTRCKKPVGELSGEEFLATYGECGGVGLCFDCDPDSCQTKPSLFWMWEPGDVFHYGDFDLVVSEDGKSLISPVEWLRERTREDTRADGLSSSTYLNAVAKNMAILADGREFGDCPECWGDGWIEKKNGKFGCLCCEGTGRVLLAVNVPGWLLSGGAL